MNDSMTRLIKPLITCICAHYRQTNQICSKLFFLNQSKHILIFIQELCIYKTIAFYDSSLVIKKISKFFFSGFFSSHPVAYSRPPGRVSAPPRESVRAPPGGRAPPVENHCRIRYELRRENWTSRRFHTDYFNIEYLFWT